MAIDRTATKPSQTQTSGQFSTFFVADLFFGVDVLDVQEVLRAQQMTRVPQAPDIIEGLINLRGQIVTAIDMRRRLQLPPQPGDRPSMNMVIRTADGAVSLLVDEIGDVLDMDAATYERPPQNLDPAAREVIRGVYKMKDGLLLVLDTDQAIQVSSVSAPPDGNTHPTQAGKRPASLFAEGAHGETENSAQFESQSKNGINGKAVSHSNDAGRGAQPKSG